MRPIPMAVTPRVVAHNHVDDVSPMGIVRGMKAEFTAILEEAPEGGYWAICPEVSGANGQGDTVEEAKASLRDAIRLVLEG